MNLGFDIVLRETKCVCEIWANLMKPVELEQQEEEQDLSIYILTSLTRCLWQRKDWFGLTRTENLTL